ncbi:MAG: hypothetical protein IKJ05_02955 [Oscillospiraceae bacterium]|nr:hypothetical protein [Oscillospiraceae bacterium]
MKLFFMLMVLSVPALVISHYVSLHKKNKILMEEMNRPVQMPDVYSVYATVVKKDVFMEKNVLSPEKIVHTHKLVYGVQFLTEDNQTVEYSVPEELYDYIYIGQKGILATVDGEFFDFDHGDNI